MKPYQPGRLLGKPQLPTAGVRRGQRGQPVSARALHLVAATFLHPSLLAFDAPSREECAAERNRSNIPQQALVLLNDPTYVEAARAFAARILREARAVSNRDSTWAWQLALQRDPRPEEMKTIRDLLDQTPRRSTGRTRMRREELLKIGLAPRARRPGPGGARGLDSRRSRAAESPRDHHEVMR